MEHVTIQEVDFNQRGLDLRVVLGGAFNVVNQHFVGQSIMAVNLDLSIDAGAFLFDQCGEVVFHVVCAWAHLSRYSIPQGLTVSTPNSELILLCINKAAVIARHEIIKNTFHIIRAGGS